MLLDRRNIRFLERFRGDEAFVLAAISAGPLLLGKAGLLEGRRFTSGVFEEFLDAFPVMPGIVRAPLVEDGNLVTAHGGAFREFAVAVAHRVGIDCPETIFASTAGEAYTEEDFTFHLPPEELPEARAYWDSCLRAAEASKADTLS